MTRGWRSRGVLGRAGRLRSLLSYLWAMGLRAVPAEGGRDDAFVASIHEGPEGAQEEAAALWWRRPDISEAGRRPMVA